MAIANKYSYVWEDFPDYSDVYVDAYTKALGNYGYDQSTIDQMTQNAFGKPTQTVAEAVSQLSPVASATNSGALAQATQSESAQGATNAGALTQASTPQVKANPFDAVTSAWNSGDYAATNKIIADSGLTAKEIQSHYGLDDNTMNWVLSQGVKTADTATGALTTAANNTATTANTGALTQAVTGSTTGNTGVSTGVSDADADKLVRDAYASIGRTGIGGEANQIDQDGYNAWVSAVKSGAINPTDLTSTFSTAVKDYIAQNPDDKYTKYVTDYQAKQTGTTADTKTADTTTAADTTKAADTAVSNAYFKANPDVAAAYAANSNGMTPEQYAQAHYESSGADEGRQSPSQISFQSSDNFKNAIDLKNGLFLTPDGRAFYADGREEKNWNALDKSVVGNANLVKLTKQILDQGTTAHWSGQGWGSPEANAASIASALLKVGIDNIYDLGKVPVYEQVQEIGKTYNGNRVYPTGTDEYGNNDGSYYYSKPTGETDYEGNPIYQNVFVPKDAKLESVYGQYDGYETVTPVDSSKLKTVDGKLVVDTGRTTFGNTKTGEAIAKNFSAQQGDDILSGTTAGSGNTAFRVDFSQGAPVFYTTYASSNDLVRMFSDSPLLGKIATIAAGYFGGPAGVAALQAAMGKGIEDIAKGALLTYVGGEIAGNISGSADLVNSVGADAANVIGKSVGKFVSSEGKADIITSLAGGAVDVGVGKITDNIEGFKDLSQGQQDFTRSVVATTIKNGGDLSMGDLVDAAFTAGTAATKASATGSIATAIEANKTINDAVTAEINNQTTIDASGAKDLNAASAFAEAQGYNKFTFDGKTYTLNNTNAENTIAQLESEALTANTAANLKGGEFDGYDAAVAANAAKDNVKIGNAEADTLEEAAALAKTRNPTATTFTYGDKTYTLGTSDAQVQSALNEAKIAETQGNIDSAKTFNEAYKAARDGLGAGKIFTWNGKQYTTDTREENPSLAAASDIARLNNIAASTEAGGGRGSAASYATYDAKAAADALSKTKVIPDFSAGDAYGFNDTVYDPSTGVALLNSTATADPNTALGRAVIAANNAVGSVVQTGLSNLANAGGEQLAAFGGALATIGVTDANNMLVKAGQAAQQIGSAIETAESKQGTQNIISAVSKAEGMGGKLIAGLKAGWENPVAALNMITREGFQEILPAGVALKASKIMSLAAAAGIDTALNAGESMGQAYNDAYSAAMAKGMTKEAADALATKVGLSAGAITLVTSGVMDAALIKTVFREGSGTVSSQLAKGSTKEGISENIEETATALATQYLTTGKIDIGDAMTQGALGHLVGKTTAGSVGAVDVAAQTETINNNIATAVTSGDAASVNTAINNSVQQSLSGGASVEVAVGASVNSAITNGADAGSSITSAVTSAVTNGADVSQTVTSSIDSAITAGADTSVAINSTVTSAITSGADSSVVVNSAVTSAVTAGADMTSSVTTAVQAAVASGANVTTATNSATTAAVTASITSGADVSTAVTSGVTAAVAAGADVTTATNTATSAAVTASVTAGADVTTAITNSVQAAVTAGADVTTAATTATTAAVTASINAGANTATSITTAVEAAVDAGATVTAATNAATTAAVTASITAGTSTSTAVTTAVDAAVTAGATVTSATNAAVTAAVTTAVTTGTNTATAITSSVNAAVTSGANVNTAVTTAVTAAVDSSITTAVNNGTSVATAITSSVTSSINAAVTSNTSVTTAVGTAVSTSITSAVTNNTNVATAVDSAVTSAVTTAITSNVNSTTAVSTAVNSAVSTAITNNVDANTAITTSVTSAVNAAVTGNVNVTTATNTAVTSAVDAAITSGVDVTTAITTAVNAAVSTNANVDLADLTKLATDTATKTQETVTLRESVNDLISGTSTATATATTQTTPKSKTSSTAKKGAGLTAGLIGGAVMAGELDRLPPQMLKAYMTQDKFVDPLAKLQALQEGMNTEKMPETPQVNTQEPDMPDQGTWKYGTAPDDIDSLFEEEAPAFKEGGFVAPLQMASGGAMALPLLAKSGGALGALPRPDGRMDFRHGAHVAGEGDGQSDDIKAMLADGEFVFPADVVSALGNGSTKAGSDKLYEMMHAIRARARSKKPKDLPPPALKSPLDYLKKKR